MLLVSWEQWYEVFDRLEWRSPLPEELWMKLGGGPSRRIDWPEIYRLTQTIGWSDKHAQTLWLTLSNFADQAPEPGKNLEGDMEEEIVEPAPWENPVMRAKPVQEAPAIQVKDPQAGRSIHLPAWMGRLSKRTWILIGVAAVVLIGLYVYTQQGNESITRVDNGAQVVPDSNKSDVAAYQNFLATYYSWKTANPAPQLCLMIQGCNTASIKKRLAGLSPDQIKQGVAIYRQQGKGVSSAIFAPQGSQTIAQIKQQTGGKTVYMCATLSGKGTAVKAVADQQYNAQNLMLGNIWGACAKQAPLS